MIRSARVFLCIVVLVIGSTLVLPSPVSAGDVSVEIEPTRGPVGTIVQVKITGLVSGGQVTVAFASKDNIVDTVTPDDEGYCIASFMVSNYVAGTYKIWVKYGANEYSFQFSVEPSIELNKTSVSVGDKLSVSGKGFAAEKPLTVYFDDLRVTSEELETDENGIFAKVSFTIPAASKGTHIISVRDSQGNSASDSIVVKQAVTMLPASGPPGSVVSISGNGFLADSSIVIYFDGEDITGVLASDNGSFSTTFRIPVCSTGTYKIKVSDGNNLYYQDFNVTAGLIITPVAGGVGVYLTVEGTGFRSGLPVTLSYDGDIIQTIAADVQGCFSTTLRVPPGTSGEHKVSVTDGINVVSGIFTVESDPPPTPALILPRNESEIKRQAYFDWEGINDPSGVTYNLVIASDANFSSVVLVKENLFDSEYTLDNHEKLPPSEGVPYYWRVRAVDSTSTPSDWSLAGTFFITRSPPRLLMPTNGATTAGMIHFDWERNDEATDVTYTLMIATDSELSRVLLARRGLTTTEYTLSNEERLPSSKESPYYWQVKATESSSDTAEWSAIGIFYVTGSPQPPAPKLISPVDGDETAPGVYFDWSGSEEAKGATYSLAIASDTDFLDIVLMKENLPKSEYALADEETLMPRQSPYYWRIKASSGILISGDWSDSGVFYVAPPMPNWARYSLAGLGLVFLCFVCFWLGNIKGLKNSTNSATNKRENNY